MVIRASAPPVATAAAVLQAAPQQGCAHRPRPPGTGEVRRQGAGTPVPRRSGCAQRSRLTGHAAAARLISHRISFGSREADARAHRSILSRSSGATAASSSIRPGDYGPCRSLVRCDGAGSARTVREQVRMLAMPLQCEPKHLQRVLAVAAGIGVGVTAPPPPASYQPQ